MAVPSSARLPTTLLFLILLNGCVGLISLFIAIELLTDPSGVTLWLSTAALHHSPFDDYTLPGLWLLALVGAPSILAGISLMLRWKFAGQASLFAGLLVVVFSALDLAWFGPQMWHQLLYALAGLTQVALSFCALARAAR